MTIISGVNKEGAGPRGAISPTNHTAWLEQLESAQWQERLRYRTEGGQQRASSDDSSSGRHEEAATKPALQSSDDDTGRATGLQPTRSQAFATASALHAVNGTATAGTANLSPTIASVPSSSQRTALANEPEIALPVQMRRLQTATWQAQHTHAMASADGLRIWIRDARYEGRDGVRLLRGLREQFGRLGLRLAQFTLNGRRMSEPDRVD